MGSGTIVHKKIVPGDSREETIERCLTPYQDKLRSNLASEDAKTRDGAARALAMEEIMDKYSDEFLPDRFKGKDYSRLNSVYTFPSEFPEDWYYPNLVPDDYSFAQGETVIQMKVDDTSALVLPMSIPNIFYSKKFDGEYRWLEEERDIEKIENYWASAVSLEELNRDFEEADKYIWYSEKGNKRIDNPEVLIPDWSLNQVSFPDLLDASDHSC